MCRSNNVLRDYGCCVDDSTQQDNYTLLKKHNSDLIILLQKKDVIINSLENIVVELTQEIVELKNEKGLTNSKTTNLPPSKDLTKQNAESENIDKTVDDIIEPSPENRSTKPKTNKKIGGQKGHKGKSMDVVDPNEFVEHKPNFCSCCGELLSSYTYFTEKTQTEVEIVISYNAVQHDFFSCTCGCCGTKNITNEQKECSDTNIVYGDSFKAFSVLMNNSYNIAYKKYVI